MNSTSSQEADTERPGRPDVLHDAVEAMLASARRLASEAKSSSAASVETPRAINTSAPSSQLLHPRASGDVFFYNRNALEDQAKAHPTRALCCAAGAGVLFSLLLRKVN